MGFHIKQLNILLILTCNNIWPGQYLWTFFPKNSTKYWLDYRKCICYRDKGLHEALSLKWYHLNLVRWCQRYIKKLFRIWSRDEVMYVI